VEAAALGDLKPPSDLENRLSLSSSYGDLPLLLFYKDRKNITITIILLFLLWRQTPPVD